MKKKSIFVLSLVAVLVFAITTAAFAKQVNYYLKGEITAINDGPPVSFDILKDDGNVVTVFLPADFEGILEIGYTVLVKGIWVEGGFEATSVEVVDPEGEGDGEGDDGGRGGVYCDGGKEYHHPVALKIAGMYGWEETPSENGDTPVAEEITPEWVMEQFCAGFGFGEIMHALILAEGDGFYAREILSMRVDMGWGQIWKELGIMKNDKESNPPPGWLKKPDKLNNPPPGWEKKPDKEKNQPPGWAKKPDK
jgi:hypothetical protein